MMWFTADLHFGHSSILSKMNRPFETIERMNQGLIAAINERVAPSDSLYVLGDFAYQTTAENARRLREQITCEHVYLIRGNHDDSWSTGAGAGIFETEQDYLEIAPGYVPLPHHELERKTPRRHRPARPRPLQRTHQQRAQPRARHSSIRRGR